MAVFEKRRVGGTSLAVETLGCGCASLGNLFHPVSDADARQILDSAWSRGFRYYDTAPHYGQGLSERRVGDALRGFRGAEYVLSTKVGRLLKPSGYAEERHAFVPMAEIARLDNILCEIHERTVGRDHCVRFERQVLQLPASRHRPHYFKVSVKVRRHMDGTLSVWHGPRLLARYRPDGHLLTEPLERAA